MTANILNEFRELLGQANWMDEQSKKFATEKVNSMSSKIGYPDYILNNNFMEKFHKDVKYQNQNILSLETSAF